MAKCGANERSGETIDERKENMSTDLYIYLINCSSFLRVSSCLADSSEMLDGRVNIHREPQSKMRELEMMNKTRSADPKVPPLRNERVPYLVISHLLPESD